MAPDRTRRRRPLSIPNLLGAASRLRSYRSLSYSAPALLGTAKQNPEAGFEESRSKTQNEQKDKFRSMGRQTCLRGIPCLSFVLADGRVVER